MAQRDEKVGQHTPQYLAGENFMRRVGIGVQKAHRDGLDVKRGQLLRKPHDGRRIERHEDLARRIHALGAART